MANMGRPTIYEPSIGEQIIDLMAAGLSLTAAAAECDVGRSTVYRWKAENDDFRDTINLAMAKRQAFLERRLLSAEQGPVVTSTIFALKNAGPEDWRDKREVEHSGEMNVRKLDQLSDDELSQVAAGG
jgi:hypothetical protein|tara:strand:- start:13232 stop:13615 length:384 start_codon:yes stop_codon:yes gene_type:complete